MISVVEGRTLRLVRGASHSQIYVDDMVFFGRCGVNLTGLRTFLGHDDAFHLHEQFRSTDIG